jgi:DNA-binding NarL/FixJ family response regulator
MIRVLLVDDHPAVRAGYARFLEQDGGIVVIAEAVCADSGYAAYQYHHPDVTVVDLSLPTVGGLELLRKIRRRDAQAKVLICSMHDSKSLVRSATEGGAAGFVTKSAPPDNLVKGVKAVYRGQRYLSDDLVAAAPNAETGAEAARIAQLSLRELEIWRLLAQGYSVAQCAQNLNLSLKTVANHQTTIRDKLAVSSTAALVHLAQRHQLIDPPPNL